MSKPSKELTDTQRSLLIWFFNNKESVTIDFGNILFAHGVITDDTFDEKNECQPNLKVLMDKGFVSEEDPPLDCFYYITDKGKAFLDKTVEKHIIFQCDHCGDIWSPDIEDPMILEAYLTEHPDGHVSIEMCESCERENEAWEEINEPDEIDEDSLDEDNLFWKEVADIYQESDNDKDTP